MKITVGNGNFVVFLKYKEKIVRTVIVYYAPRHIMRVITRRATDLASASISCEHFKRVV